MNESTHASSVNPPRNERNKPRGINPQRFSWIDTYPALIWPDVAGVFGAFLLRQFFVGIPFELQEAARMDGANSFYVILPLNVPALVSLGVFAFMGSWNNYV